MKLRQPSFEQLTNEVYKSLHKKKQSSSAIDIKLRQYTREFILNSKPQNDETEDLSKAKKKFMLLTNHNQKKEINKSKKKILNESASLCTTSNFYNKTINKEREANKKEFSNFISNAKIFSSNILTNTTSTQSSSCSNSMKNIKQKPHYKISKIKQDLNDFFTSNNNDNNDLYISSYYTKGKKQPKNKYTAINNETSIKTINLDNSINNANNSHLHRTRLTLFKNDLVSFLKKDISYSGNPKKQNIIKANNKTSDDASYIRKGVLSRAISSSSLIKYGHNKERIDESPENKTGVEQLNKNRPPYYKSNFSNFMKFLPKNYDKKEEIGNISVKLNSFRTKLDMQYV